MKTTKQILMAVMILLAFAARGQNNVVLPPNNATTGLDNVIIGNGAGHSVAGSLTPATDSNVYIGRAAGYYSFGANNVMIGNNAGLGSFASAGSRNVFLGNGAGQNQNYMGLSDHLVIHNSNVTDPLIEGDFASHLLTLTGDITINPIGSSLNSGLLFEDLHNTNDTRYLTTDNTGRVVFGANPAWSLNGNTVSAANFIGTVNAVDLVFRSHNNLAGRITPGNTALGTDALLTNTTGAGDNNTAIGAQALRNVAHTSGDNNTAVGVQSSLNNFSGRGNTSVGFQAGMANTIGNGSVFLGNNAGASETSSSRLYISNSDNIASPGGGTLIYGEFDARKLRFNVDGSIVTPPINGAFSTRVEIVGRPNESGLRLNHLTTASPVGANPGAGVLSVNNDGDVILVNDATTPPTNDDWKLAGNNITPGQFLGTTNDNNLVFKRNSIKAGFVSPNSVGLGFNSTANSPNGPSELTTNSVYIGRNAGNWVVAPATDNTYVGNMAGGASNSAAVRNSYFGSGAGRNTAGNVNLGSDNVCMGWEAGVSNNTGNRNVYIGNRAGFGCSVANGNVFLGFNAGFNESVSDRLYISNNANNQTNALVYGQFDTRLIRFNVNNPSSIIDSAVEINGQANESGLRFSSLNITTPTTASNTKFLTLDNAGNVVLENVSINGTLANGSNTTVTGTGTTADPYTIEAKNIYNSDGELTSNRYVDMKDYKMIFDTQTEGRIYVGDTGTSDFGTDNFETATGNYRLYVEGGILTEKVKVALRHPVSGDPDNWADYVFAKDYKLMPLKEVESFVKAYKHLPGIESSEELHKNGLDIADMQAKQMEKIEELTLHLIDQNKTIEKQNQDIEILKEQVKMLLEKK